MPGLEPQLRFWEPEQGQGYQSKGEVTWSDFVSGDGHGY